MENRKQETAEVRNRWGEGWFAEAGKTESGGGHLPGF
jgi:hypothetical protein